MDIDDTWSNARKAGDKRKQTMITYTYPMPDVTPEPGDLCLATWPVPGDVVECDDRRTSGRLKGIVQICDLHCMLLMLFDLESMDSLRWIGYGDNIVITKHRT